MQPLPSRDDLASRYFDQLPYHPIQCRKVRCWLGYVGTRGIGLCSNRTGKNVDCRGALFEALHTDTVAYYTTPLICVDRAKVHGIAKFCRQMGIFPDDIGLVTGNRRVNPQAKVLVVVAEILLNRLLHPEAFSFDQVSAVVMDEFHSFADIERGIVWELSLAMLPPLFSRCSFPLRLEMPFDFSQWLQRSHNRRLEWCKAPNVKCRWNFVGLATNS